MEAWARCAAPNASFTNTVAPVSATICFANAGSFFSSSGWKRVFSSRRTSPSASPSASAHTSAPTQSGAVVTGRPISPGPEEQISGR